MDFPSIFHGSQFKHGSAFGGQTWAEDGSTVTPHSTQEAQHCQRDLGPSNLETAEPNRSIPMCHGKFLGNPNTQALFCHILSHFPSWWSVAPIFDPCHLELEHLAGPSSEAIPSDTTTLAIIDDISRPKIYAQFMHNFHSLPLPFQFLWSKMMAQ